MSELPHHFRIMRKDDSSRFNVVYSMAERIEQGLGFVFGCRPGVIICLVNLCKSIDCSRVLRKCLRMHKVCGDTYAARIVPFKRFFLRLFTHYVMPCITRHYSHLYIFRTYFNGPNDCFWRT